MVEQRLVVVGTVVTLVFVTEDQVFVGQLTVESEVPGAGGDCGAEVRHQLTAAH